MRKGGSVIGQPVYSVADGSRVDSVKDLVLEEGDDGVVALLISEGGLLSTSTVVPFGSVTRFGPSAVMIADSAAVMYASADPRVNEILGRQGRLRGTHVLSESGQDLGTLTDFYFDETSGRIMGYELSDTTLGINSNRTFLPVDHIRTVGPDAVITSDAARDVKAGTAPATEDAASSLPSTNDSDRVLVGARARADLTDRDGAIVVASGQRITAPMVERARAEGELDALYDVTGVPRPGAEPDPTGEALSRAAESASDLWARFTTRLSEMTDDAGRRVDAAQTRSRLDAINDAIGRPVTKVILDRDDSVILDLGDLVTHQAVQRANDAGLLDSLLASVYKASDLTFARDEMRAEIAGDSTVDKASGGATVVTELETHIEHVEAADTSPKYAETPTDGEKAGRPQRAAVPVTGKATEVPGGV